MWRLTWQTEPKWKLPEYTWGEEKKTCESCKHYRPRMSGNAYQQHIVMTCRLNRMHRAHHSSGSCISMRYEGECGRLATLFEPK